MYFIVLNKEKLIKFEQKNAPTEISRSVNF